MNEKCEKPAPKPSTPQPQHGMTLVAQRGMADVQSVIHEKTGTDGGNAGDSLKEDSFMDKVEGSRILHCRHCDYGTRRELELLIHLRKHGYSAPDQSDYWIEKTSDFQW
jgi:hypothetical protein